MSKLKSIVRKYSGWQTLNASGRDVFRNMAVLAMGAGSAKVIGFISIPILTRIFSPEDFGVLALFTAFTAVVVPLVTLRYVVAIPLPKSDGLAVNIVALAFSLTLVFTLLIATMLYAFHSQVFSAFSLELLSPYWWLLPLGILGTACYEILSLWATRTKDFKPLAKSQIWQSFIGAVTKIGLGLLAIKPLGLLLGQVIQQSGGIVLLIVRFGSAFRGLASSIRSSRMKFLAYRFSNIPFYRLPSQFLMVVATKTPVFYSGVVFSTGVTGQVGLALTVIALPIGLLGTTTGKAYYAELAKIGKKNRYAAKQVTTSVLKRLALFALIPTLVLLFAGEQIFVLVFGEQWMEAGRLASILAIYLFLQFLTAPLVHALTVFEKQSLFLKINIVRAFVLAAVFSFAFMYELDIYQTFLIYSGCLSIHYMYVLKQIYSCFED